MSEIIPEQHNLPENINCFCCPLKNDQQTRNENFMNRKITELITEAPTKNVDNLTIAEVLNQLKELKMKLQRSENERDEFKGHLKDLNYEKDKIARQLEIISSAHESRITEMHCVIAELSKKLRNKQDNTILEENEPEGSEISYQEGSIYNSEMNLTNPDAECQTEPIEDIGGNFNNSNFGDDLNDFYNNETLTKTQVETLQEEVFHLKAQIALLESQLAINNSEIIKKAQNEEKLQLSPPENPFNYTNDYKEDCTPVIITSNEQELNNCFYSSNDDNEISQLDEFYKTDEQAIDNDYIVNNKILSNNKKKEKFVNNTSAIKQSTTRYLSNNILNSDDNYHVKNSNSSPPIPKLAERVKLKRTDQNVTGTDILNTGLNKTELVEHLVSSMIQSNNIINDFIEPSQYHVEFQRLQRKVDHLKARNNVLSLTLDEVKEHLDHIYLLCGKYESNSVALQCALNYSDRAIEAYDVMLALLESKFAMLKENSISAEESRKAVEAVAKHLLDRLESEKNLSENSLGPWQNTFCLNDTQSFDPWTLDDDNRLRNHVSKLKGRRATIQNTTVNLESPFSSYYEKSRIALETNAEFKQENAQMDLEMAVMMQELLSLREDVVEERRKRELSEKEKQFAIEKSYVLHETLHQLQIQLSDSEKVLNFTSKDRSSYSESDHAALIERQLVEALTRESELKTRIQTLIGTVTNCKKQEEKHVQVQNTELQKININLSHSLEQTKRKYQTKIKRLEQKITDMNLELSQVKKSTTQQKRNLDDNVPETTL